MIKSWIAAGSTIATLFILTGEAHSADLSDLRKLIQTNSCKGCDLSEAKLSGLDLSDAVLTGANLEGADLQGTNLTRATLKSVNLQSANISKANFTGAQLSGANLTKAQNSDICISSLLFGMQSFRGERDSEHSNDQRCLMFSLMGSFGPELCEPEFRFREFKLGKQFCEVLESNSGSLSTILGLEIGSFFQVTSFFGADMTDAIVESVDLKAADFRYATLNQTSFQDSDLTYALMLDSDMQGISDTALQSAFVTKDDITRTFQEAIAKEQEAKRQAEGPATLGTLIRAQQAYRLENGKFANAIEQLDARLPSSSNFDFSIVPQGDRAKTVISARSLAIGLKSFVGIGTYSSDASQFQFLLCGTSEPSQTLPSGLGESDTEQCPVGMEQIN